MTGHDTRTDATDSSDTTAAVSNDITNGTNRTITVTPTSQEQQPALTRNERKRRFREEQAAARLAAAADGATQANKKKPQQQLRMPASAFLSLTEEHVQRRCVIAYDGSHFQGFQAQEQREARRTVQETIEDALLRTTGETIRIRAASRTDAGVHARGQVIAFVSRCALDDRVFRDALNNRLPDDVLCRSMMRIIGTDEPFDPRAHSKRKTYAYTIVNGGLRPVFGRERVWFVKKPLDVVKMREASAYFLQAPVAKDYSSFTPQKALADHDGGSGNVCKITSIEIGVEPVEKDQVLRLDTDTNGTMDIDINLQNEDPGRRIKIVFQGDRFLYKMVRNLVGTLVDVGLGRIAPESIPLILEAKSRAKAGQGAPPHGLTLVHIAYDT